MELHDSIEFILRLKGSQVYSITPDVTVYEALEEMPIRTSGLLS